MKRQCVVIMTESLYDHSQVLWGHSNFNGVSYGDWAVCEAVSNARSENTCQLTSDSNDMIRFQNIILLSKEWQSAVFCCDWPVPSSICSSYCSSLNM